MSNTPKLRFSEFSGDWEEKKFQNIFKIFQGFAFSSLDSVKEGTKWVKITDVGIQKMAQSNPSYLPYSFRKEYNKYILVEGDYVIALTRPILNNKLKIARINKIYHNSLLNQRVGKLVTNNNYSFVNCLLQKNNIVNKINMNISGTEPPNLSISQINSMKTYIPLSLEQEKIASFLTSIDIKIERLTKKESLLKDYKKGVMQKIFNQEIRFKDDDGSEFCEWHNKYSNNIFETITNKKHNSDLPILAISQEFGAIPRDMINYKITATEKSVSSYKVVDIGDFVISLRSFQGGIEYSNYKGICSPAYIILRPHIDINRDFFKFYFKTKNYINLLNRYIEGIRDGKMVSFKQFSEIKIPYPSIKEQTKISEFLFTIDRKIEITNIELKKTKEFKKALLQQMFV